MDPTVVGAVLGASIAGVATVAAAFITAWAAGHRGGQQPTERDTSQRPRSQAQDQQLEKEKRELERERWRGRIALALVLGLIVIVLATFWYLVRVTEGLSVAATIPAMAATAPLFIHPPS
jgi:hypothetical protein